MKFSSTNAVISINISSEQYLTIPLKTIVSKVRNIYRKNFTFFVFSILFFLILRKRLKIDPKLCLHLKHLLFKNDEMLFVSLLHSIFSHFEKATDKTRFGLKIIIQLKNFAETYHFTHFILWSNIVHNLPFSLQKYVVVIIIIEALK